jgi:hypothetical protein
MSNYIKRPIVFVVLWLLFFSLQAQNSRNPQSAAKPATPDSSFSKTKELTNEVQGSTSNILQYEKGISLEIRRGVKRLTKACSAPENKLENKQTVTPLENINESIQRKLQEVSGTKASLNARLDVVVTSATKLAEEKCSGSVVPFFASNACISSQELNNSIKVLQNSLNIYYDQVKARYQLYQEVASKEAEGCVKNGFTERLLKANEQHVISTEDSARLKFLELIKSADDTSRLLRQ